MCLSKLFESCSPVVENAALLVWSGSGFESLRCISGVLAAGGGTSRDLGE